MRVVWLSNRRILNEVVDGSGSWITSMAERLGRRNDVSIVNITEGDVKEIELVTTSEMKEYIIPRYRIKRTGLPSKNNINRILDVINKENPEIIHVWGVEKYWGLLKSNGYLDGYPCILEIQGVLDACYSFYQGNLSLDDFMRVMNPVLALYSYYFIKVQKYRMGRRVWKENVIINSYNEIGIQSQWVRDWVQSKNRGAKLYNSLIAVRDDYLSSNIWEYREENNTILLVSSSQAYKRIDIAINALVVLKYWGLDLNLCIVGPVMGRFKGYSCYLNALAKSKGVEKSIRYVGNKTAAEIINIARTSICAIVPSNVESYSLVTAECLAFGIPVVASYAGALPEFSIDSKVPFYFPSGDAIKCASIIKSIYMGGETMNAYSVIERNAILEKGDPANRQYQIYCDILAQ